MLDPVTRHARAFEVKSFRLPLLGIFAFFAVLCMYTATFVTPDPRMPQVFSSKDNYERFLPTLAKRYEQQFNPFRLKVRVHIGINATDPIDRGTTPDYNDCFFNCAGQKPNYVDIFASAGNLVQITFRSVSQKGQRSRRGKESPRISVEAKKQSCTVHTFDAQHYSVKSIPAS